MFILNKIVPQYTKILCFLPLILLFILAVNFEGNVRAGDFPLKSLFVVDTVEDINQAIKEMNIGSNYNYLETGICSYYGKRFQNCKTSNGERFDMNGFTAAHRELPFGMILKVTNQLNNQSVLVRINDRGPFMKNRIIDLSRNAAVEIDMHGTEEVKLQGFKPGLTPIGNSAREAYFYGFSITKDLVCLPSSVIETIHKSADFDEIMLEYINYTETKPDAFVYIFVQTDYLTYSTNSQVQLQYYLGRIDINAKSFIEADNMSEIK